jgi:phenylalanyl-tRNA synthetase beta chain
VIKDRNGKVCAEWGLVKKAITNQLGIQQPVYFAELNWTELMKKTKKQNVLYKELSKFPAVSRDLALLVDKNVEFAAIERAAYQAEKKLLKRVELFDVYEGKNLEPGKKSYAVNFTLQDEQKTMNDKQTDAIMQKIIKMLEKQVGAQLR